MPRQVGRDRVRPGKFRTPYGVRHQRRPGHRPGAALRRGRHQQPGPGVHAGRRVRHPVRRLRRARRVGHASPRCAAWPWTDRTGNVWAADLWGDRIERWDRTPTGFTYDRTIGAVMPEPTWTAVFHEPRGMAFAPNGDLWVSDTVHHGFRGSTATATWSTMCGQRAAEGTQLGQFNWPRGIAVDPATGNLWVADTKQHQLQVLTADCEGIGFVKGSPGRHRRALLQLALRHRDPPERPVGLRRWTPRTTGSRRTTWPTRRGRPTTRARCRRTCSAAGAARTSTSSSRAAWPSGPTATCSSPTAATTGSRSSAAAATGFAHVKHVERAGGSLNEPEGVAVDATGRVVVADSADDEMVVMAPDRHGRGDRRRPAPPVRRSRSDPTAPSTSPTPTPTWCAPTPWARRRPRTRRPPTGASRRRTHERVDGAPGRGTITRYRLRQPGGGGGLRRAAPQRRQHLAARQRHLRARSSGCRPAGRPRRRHRRPGTSRATLPVDRRVLHAAARRRRGRQPEHRAQARPALHRGGGRRRHSSADRRDHGSPANRAQVTVAGDDHRWRGRRQAGSRASSSASGRSAPTVVERHHLAGDRRPRSTPRSPRPTPRPRPGPTRWADCARWLRVLDRHHRHSGQARGRIPASRPGGRSRSSDPGRPETVARRGCMSGPRQGTHDAGRVRRLGGPCAGS